MPTQNEYDSSKSIYKNLNIKLYLLNYKFQIVDELSGVTVSPPSFTNDSSSDIRRSCNVTFTPTDKSFDIGYGNKIWLDKYIQIFIGIKTPRLSDYEWTNMGIYLINNPSNAYDATNNTISISGVDLMAKLTGLRNGNLEGITYSIPSGTNIRNLVIDTIALGGFTKYVVEEFPITVPNDIEISAGGAIFDILSQITSILPNYTMYFDVDGVFHFEKIPTGDNEQIMVDDDIWSSTLISYQKDNNFENVKNEITVIGKTVDVSYHGGLSTLSGSIYSVTIADLTDLTDGDIIGFISPSYTESPKLSINTFGAKNIKNEDGTIPTFNNSSTFYCVEYVESGDYYKFLGEDTPSYTIQETNPESPFYINGTFGKVRIVLSGGDYDNINSLYLAKLRAKWELYNYCKLQDSVTLTCVPIYWLDVNWIISITLPNKNGTELTEKYIIKSISTDSSVGGTQSIQLMKYYPYYPSI